MNSMITTSSKISMVITQSYYSLIMIVSHMKLKLKTFTKIYGRAKINLTIASTPETHDILIKAIKR